MFMGIGRGRALPGAGGALRGSPAPVRWFPAQQNSPCSVRVSGWAGAVFSSGAALPELLALCIAACAAMGVEVLALKVLPIVHRPDRPQSQLPGGLQVVGLAPEPLGSAVFYDYALKFIERQRMGTDIVENLPDLSRLTRGGFPL